LMLITVALVIAGCGEVKQSTTIDPPNEAEAAETPWKVYVRFGFMGTWTSSCDTPPSIQNSWYVISKGDQGTVFLTSNRGSDLPPGRNIIDRAEFLNATTIRVHELSNDPIDIPHSDKPHSFDVVLENANGRVRTLESVRNDGTVLVKNGVNIARGQATRWLEKCGD
jgi:hypothetical protein